MRKLRRLGEVVLALAVVLWCVFPAMALTRTEVSVSSTTGCSNIQATNYVLIVEGEDVHWECSGETVLTTGKAALKETDGPITVFESCLKLCYKTTSGTATLRIFSSP